MRTYNPNRYTLILAGIPIPTKGYADGTFIKLERAKDAFGKVVGTDGSVTRFKDNDKSARLTFSTMQLAAINDVLSTLHNLDVNSDNGEGVGPFKLLDLDGTTVYFAKACWIARAPDPTLDRAPTQRDWIVDIEELQGNEGS